jgi:hypothetical protein
MVSSRCGVLRACAVALALGGALPGCALFRELGLGGDDPQWVERRYRGVSADTVLRLAETAVRDRYPLREVDLYRGQLETGWVYGLYSERTHQGLRQRVLVRAAADGEEMLVRLRVQQEVSESAGRMVSSDPGDWEPYDDDAQEAKRLLTKLHILLRDVAETPPDPAAGTSAGAQR